MRLRDGHGRACDLYEMEEGSSHWSRKMFRGGKVRVVPAHIDLNISTDTCDGATTISALDANPQPDIRLHVEPTHSC